MTAFISRTAAIRAAAKQGPNRAEPMLAELLRDLFAIEARNVAINHDQYSLNSLNGFFATDAGEFFFKFHQEEGEEAMSGEYYRADILARAGLPVDQPIHMSVLPGEQGVVLCVLAPQVEPAMQLLQQVWATWRQAAWGLKACAPRVWRL